MKPLTVSLHFKQRWWFSLALKVIKWWSILVTHRPPSNEFLNKLIDSGYTAKVIERA